MTIITVTPVGAEDMYTLLVEKERELRRAGRGTLHRQGPRKRGQEKWRHTAFKGWLKLQRSLGGVVVVEVRGRSDRDEWQLVTSLTGFLQRHFGEEIGSVHLTFATEE